jgi:hypothetical protein
MTENDDFEQIEKCLKNLPLTWYPALLITIVEQCIERNIFQKGQIAPLVKKLEDRKLKA